MKNQNLRKTVFSALFAAIICVATVVIQIPSPATNGYFNLGDCFVIIAGQLLGPLYGALAAGIGSALADIFASYIHYAPASFVIKAAMAASAAMIYRAFGKQKSLARAASGIVSEAMMVLGYFCYEGLILKYGFAAAAGIPSNAAQSVTAIVLSFAVSAALKKAKLFDKMK